MNRPYIICHMVTSIDGKVTGDFLFQRESEAGTEDYYKINRDFKADGFACGRVTMEGSFTGGWQPDLTPFADAKIKRSDRISDKEAKFFAVSFDRHGRLGWKTPRIIDEDPGYGNAHIIQVMCEDAGDDYLAYLQSIGVSYIFAGKEELDLPLALKKLKELFGIEKLLLEGGSKINGAFHKEKLIDELSLVMIPLTASKESKPLFYDGGLDIYKLMDVQKLPSGAVWLRYLK
ncbi:MAG: pyrimidine reductase [Ruminococcaceae bacterium]|nr:pyrimidine reductase [Oscillospiraceae bacterium]